MKTMQAECRTDIGRLAEGMAKRGKDSTRRQPGPWLAAAPGDS